MGFTNLKRIARYRVKRENIAVDELEDYLKTWWSEKYSLPDNHPLLLEKTFEELMLEYYVDIFQKFPDELRKFEQEIGELSPILDAPDDEAWYKKAMGDEYKAPDIVMPSPSKEEEEFEDVYPGSTLG